MPGKKNLQADFNQPKLHKMYALLNMQVNQFAYCF